METTAHRKIELQTPSDLTHLTSQCSLLARQKIDLHFPPTEGARSTTEDGDTAAAVPSSDPMRRLVEEEVQGFLSRTFDGIRHNISVNGLEGADMARSLDGHAHAPGGEGEEEAFDHRLARRVQAVSSEIETLQLQLAGLRREAPAGLAGRYVERVEEEGRVWGQKARKGEEEETRRLEEVEVRVVGLEKMEEMRKGWEEGTRRLVEVKEGIGAVVGRGEMAREGVRFLEGR